MAQKKSSSKKAAASSRPVVIQLGHADDYLLNYEKTIRSFYKFSDEQATERVRKLGLLTEKGKLKPAFK